MLALLHTTFLLYAIYVVIKFLAMRRLNPWSKERWSPCATAC
jgi:hypothetical protein